MAVKQFTSKEKRRRNFIKRKVVRKNSKKMKLYKQIADEIVAKQELYGLLRRLTKHSKKNESIIGDYYKELEKTFDDKLERVLQKKQKRQE